MLAPYAWPRSYKVSRLWNRRAHTSVAGKYLRTLVFIAIGAKLIDETCLEHVLSPRLTYGCYWDLAWSGGRVRLDWVMLLTFSRFVTPCGREKKASVLSRHIASLVRCFSNISDGTHPRWSIQYCKPKPDPSVARGCRVDTESQSPGISCTLDLLRW